MGAESASATPTSCAIGAHGSLGYYGICRSGTGTYKVVIRCYDPLRSSNSTFYGPTVGINQQSIKDCPVQGNVQTTPNGASIQQVS